MLMEIKTEKEWLEKRKGYVTSTEASALFGLNKWITHFELYHTKRGNLENQVKENSFMKFGKIMEQPVCEMIEFEKPDWPISKFPYFAFDDETKMGSSFDRVIKIDGKNYLLEIKTISYGEYKEDFIEHEADDIEASPVYEVQCQVQLDSMKGENIEGLVLAVFILDTRQLKFIFRKHDEEMCTEIRKAIAEFWALDAPPAPDYERDCSVISKLCPMTNPDNEMDATKDDRLSTLLSIYANSKELEKQEKQSAEAAKAEILTIIGDAKRVWTNDYRLNLSDIKDSKGKLVTDEMVGEYVGGRSGYKRLAIKKLTQKED